MALKHAPTNVTTLISHLSRPGSAKPEGGFLGNGGSIASKHRLHTTWKKQKGRALNENRRAAAYELIRKNTERNGCHIYLISGGPSPRCAYTIGLLDKLGAEFIIAGAA